MDRASLALHKNVQVFRFDSFGPAGGTCETPARRLLLWLCRTHYRHFEFIASCSTFVDVFKAIATCACHICLRTHLQPSTNRLAFSNIQASYCNTPMDGGRPSVFQSSDHSGSCSLTGGDQDWHCITRNFSIKMAGGTCSYQRSYLKIYR